MMECRRYGLLLPEYANGELSGTETAAVAGHLRTCARCARALEETRAVLEMSREVPAPSFDPAFWEAARRRIVGRTPERSFRVRRAALIPVLTAAAAVVVLMAPGRLSHRSPPETRIAREHMFLPSEDVLLEMVNLENEGDSEIAARILLHR